MKKVLERAAAIMGRPEPPGWARGGATLTFDGSARLPLRARLLLLLHGNASVTVRSYVDQPVSQCETSVVVTVDGVNRERLNGRFELGLLAAATAGLYLAALLLAGVPGLAFVVALDYVASSYRRQLRGLPS